MQFPTSNPKIHQIIQNKQVHDPKTNGSFHFLEIILFPLLISWSNLLNEFLVGFFNIWKCWEIIHENFKF